MAILTRQEILDASDIKQETVPVPEWGGEVIVRSMNGADRDALESSLLVGEGKKQKLSLENVRAKFVSRLIVDESGERCFSDADVVALAKKSAAALNRVYEAGVRLSGLSDDDVEAMTKN